jgi:hypothetical protein
MTVFGPARFVPHKNYSGPPIALTCGRCKRGRFVPKNVSPFHEPGYGQLPFDNYAALVAIKYAKWLAVRDGIEIPRRLKGTAGLGRLLLGLAQAAATLPGWRAHRRSLVQAYSGRRMGP